MSTLIERNRCRPREHPRERLTSNPGPSPLIPQNTHAHTHTHTHTHQFPHHDNEMAQAEAYYGCGQWVDYFLHAGHLSIRGLKMSKALKNFVTIKEALRDHPARHLRLMFLMAQWDKGIVYSDQTLDDARSKDEKLRNFFSARPKWPWQIARRPMGGLLPLGNACTGIDLFVVSGCAPKLGVAR